MSKKKGLFSEDTFIVGVILIMILVTIDTMKNTGKRIVENAAQHVVETAVEEATAGWRLLKFLGWVVGIAVAGLIIFAILTAVFGIALVA